MAKKATEGGMLTNPVKLNQLIKAAGKAFVLDTGGVPIEDFIFTMRGVTGNELTMLQDQRRHLHTPTATTREGSSAETMDDVPGGQAGQAGRVRLHQPRGDLHPQVTGRESRKASDGPVTARSLT